MAQEWREEIPHVQGQERQQRGVPMTRVRSHSREEIPNVQGQEWWPRGVTPLPRLGAMSERTYPTSKKRWLHGHRKAKRSYSTYKVRRGSHEEILLVQGKEQWLRWPRSAVERSYPMPKVRSSSCALLEQP